jgi:hypothetical protein
MTLIARPRWIRSFRAASAVSIAAAVLCATPPAPLRAADQPTLDELLDLAPPAQRPDEEEAPADASTDAGQGDDERESKDPAERGEASGGGELAEAISMDEAQGVFEQAVTEMDAVARRLGPEADAGLDTQRRQREILRKLDQIIAAARQQQSGGSSSSSSSARQQDAGSQQLPPKRSQSASSAARPGGEQAGRGEFSPGGVDRVDASRGDLEELRSEWGNLPPRLRDELTEGLSEPFSPVYRELTERFYRRLGEAE